MGSIKLNWEYNNSMSSVTQTFMSAIGDSSPVNGLVRRNIGSSSETLSTIVAGDGTLSGTGNTALGPSITSSTTSNQFRILDRIIMCFNTSTIPVGAIVTGVTLSLYGVSKNDGLGSPDLHIAAATPASTSALANSDYGQTGSTSFGNVSYASFNTSGYNVITLNASGVSNINTTGVSKFSAKLSWDIDDNFTGTWASSANSRFIFYLSDNGSNQPILSVTYNMPSVTGLSSLTGVQSITTS